MASLYQSLGIALHDKAYIAGHLTGGEPAAGAAGDDAPGSRWDHDGGPGPRRVAGGRDDPRRHRRPSSAQAAGASARVVGAPGPRGSPRSQATRPQILADDRR